MECKPVKKTYNTLTSPVSSAEARKDDLELQAICIYRIRHHLRFFSDKRRNIIKRESEKEYK